MGHDFRLPRVYPLTDVQLSGLPHAEQVRLLAEGGASFVQLREKRLPALEFYEQAKLAVAVAAEKDVQLIINDRVDVALAAGTHGVHPPGVHPHGVHSPGIHLGQDDMPPEAARRLLGPAAIIGYSTHTVQQAIAALKLPIDYIAIGPIFPTATKTDTSPVFGFDGLRAVRQAVGKFPLVAIGGITQSNASQVIEAGADSVAVISALLIDPAHISDTTEALLQSLPPV